MRHRLVGYTCACWDPAISPAMGQMRGRGILPDSPASVAEDTGALRCQARSTDKPLGHSKSKQLVLPDPSPGQHQGCTGGGRRHQAMDFGRTRWLSMT